MYLVFNEKIMTKTTACESFIVSDGDYQVSLEFDADATEIELGEECWVFNDFECEKHNSSDQLFVYFPRIGYATTVLSKLINQ